MSDPLKQSVDRITSFVSTLNKTADALVPVIKDLEDFLAENNVGVSAFVEIRRDVDPFGGPDEILSVCYSRYHGKFRIIVWEGTEQAPGTCKLWGECDRTTKLQSAAKLPGLLEKIAQELEKDANAALEAAQKVAKAIEPNLKAKGGKK